MPKKQNDARHKIMKICSKCKIEKDASFSTFGPDNRRADGFQSQCRKCRNEAKTKDYYLRREEYLPIRAAYREKNKEKIKEYFVAFNKKEKRQKYLKDYRSENLTHHKKLHAQWRRADPQRSRIRLYRYKKAKKLATPNWLSEEQNKEINLFYTEAKELSWLSDGGLSVDHIIPFQGKIVCGLHVPWNLQIIPLSDNCSKGRRFET